MCKEIFFTRRPESRELSGMEKNIEVSLLFDFYGELLKPSGKKAIDLYYNEDLSLAEVADETGITRQGVRDSIKRSEQQLFEFEEKLGLFKQFSKLEQGLDEISALALEIKELSQDTQITELADVIIKKSGSLKD
jgi:predicted DNA-binding protein YlxM (UPF0122 family)